MTNISQIMKQAKAMQEKMAEVQKKVEDANITLQSSNGAPGLKTGCPAGCGAPQFLSACDSSSSVARRIRLIVFTRLPVG